MRGLRSRSHRSDRRVVGIGSCCLLALALAVPAAVASTHKPPERLYSVSLSGSVRVEWSLTTEGLNDSGLPLGCLGSGSETFSFDASAQLGAKPTRGPVTYYGRNFPRLFTRASFSSFAAGGSVQTAGSFTPEPAGFETPSASECTYVPKRTEANCSFAERGELERGKLFQLSPELNVNPTAPLQRGNALYIYGGSPVEVRCNPSLVEGLLFAEGDGFKTSVRVGSVLALRKGKRVSASGSASVPQIGFDGKQDGTETVAYSLHIKRVR
ncbi:MAG: hypothetical protein JST31_00590 [Actinobacteria bacterium]|nr:hypothetical protein [Actinomycetota bacterium]